MRQPELSGQVPAIVPPTAPEAEGRRRPSGRRIAAFVALGLVVAAVVRVTVAPVSLPVTGMIERMAAEREAVFACVEENAIALAMEISQLDLSVFSVKL